MIEKQAAMKSEMVRAQEIWESVLRDVAETGGDIRMFLTAANAIGIRLYASAEGDLAAASLPAKLLHTGHAAAGHC